MISIAYCSPFFPITCVMSETGSVVRNSSRTWNDCAENLHTLSSKYCVTLLKYCHLDKKLNGDVFDWDLVLLAFLFSWRCCWWRQDEHIQYFALVTFERFYIEFLNSLSLFLFLLSNANQWYMGRRAGESACDRTSPRQVFGRHTCRVEGAEWSGVEPAINKWEF